MTCKDCSTVITLAGGLWVDESTRFACADGRHAPAIEPPRARPEWDNGISVQQQLADKHAANLVVIHRRADQAQAARDALGLGPFVAIDPPQELAPCSVAWVDADGAHEAQGCAVRVYGNAAMVTLLDGSRIHQRLSWPTFKVLREEFAR